MTADAWEAVQVKDLTSTLFTNVYYRPTYTAGLGTIILWPIPDNNDNSVVLYRRQQVAQFADFTTAYDFPPGYPDAFDWNLAVRLASPSQGNLPPDVGDMAKQTLAIIKRSNATIMDMPQDPAITLQQRTGYNIQTGTGGGSV